MRAMLATGMVPTEASVAASTMKPEPVTPAAPFDVRSRMPMIPSCCASERSVLVACARNSRHRQIDAGPVKIKGVARGNDEADHRLFAAKVLHFCDHARQHGLG